MNAINGVQVTKTNNVSDLANELARLRAENEALKAKAVQSVRSLTAKVSAKGGVSVYGLGRFPVTLYRQQWERLIDFMPIIQAFIEANSDQLTVKQ